MCPSLTSTVVPCCVALCLSPQPLVGLGLYTQRVRSGVPGEDPDVGWLLAGAVLWLQLASAACSAVGISLKPLQVRTHGDPAPTC